MRSNRRRISPRVPTSGGLRLSPEEIFRLDGYYLCENVFRPNTVSEIACDFESVSSGKRLFKFFGALANKQILDTLNLISNKFSGAITRPVRVIYFDKTSAKNWALGWHQDRTIAVKRRAELHGFKSWSCKAGMQHVEPPFEVMQKMTTLRVSIDKSDAESGGLEVIPGSHLFGRLDDVATQQVSASMSPRIIKSKAGDVLVLATPIVHKSGQNLSDKHRRVVHIDYSWASLPSPLEWAFEV